MKTVSSIEFIPDVDDEPTKPVDDITAVLHQAENGAVIAGAVAGAAAGMAGSAPEEKPAAEPLATSHPILFTSPFNLNPAQETPAPAPAAAPVTPEPVEPAPAVVNTPSEIVFTAGTGLGETGTENTILQPAGEPFDPYGKASSDELKNAPPLVFGDDASLAKPVQTEPEGAQSIPVPDFDIQEEKPEVKEEDKLSVDFPETEVLTTPEQAAPAAEPAPAETNSNCSSGSGSCSGSCVSTGSCTCPRTCTSTCSCSGSRRRG